MNPSKMFKALATMKKIVSGDTLLPDDIPHMPPEVMEAFNRMTPEQRMNLLQKAGELYLQKMKEKQ